jgi:MFS family permease
VEVLKARTAVVVAFFFNGALFASFVSRLPDVRSSLGLTNGGLGLLLLTASAGSVTALPLAGRAVTRWRAAPVVRTSAVLCGIALLVASIGATVFEKIWLTAPGMALYGIAVSTWDVAMNVEGAEVERRLGRTIMPRFHAMFSAGTIAGGVIGIPMTAASVPMTVHLGVVVVVSVVAVVRWTPYFLPASEEVHRTEERVASAWLEPRTLLIGVMVLAFAAVEGSANDWLTLGLIDGYQTPHWAGVAGYALFVVSMTAGRLFGTHGLDRYGRAAMLWASAAAALVGILLTVYAGHLVLALVGIVVWGLGASLGFPVGMSAAADDPRRAAARVSVVATIGYAAFLLFPPLLGWLGDRVGTLQSLLVIAALMVPAALTVAAARPPRPARAPVSSRTGA